MTLTSKPATTRRRLWPRFTLRMLLAIVTLVGVGLGYWSYRAREQRRIVELIETAGGSVCYWNEGPDGPPRSAVLAWLAKSAGRDYCDEVVEAAVQEREQVPDLVKLRRVTRLHIYCDDLDDRDVALLRRCSAIEVLSLGVDGENRVNKVSDRSLRVLGKLPKLRVLHVRGAGLSAAGINDLAASPTLEVLDVGSCAASVNASDLDAIKRQGRIQSFLAWRRARSGPDEIIARW